MSDKMYIWEVSCDYDYEGRKWTVYVKDDKDSLEKIKEILVGVYRDDISRSIEYIEREVAKHNQKALLRCYDHLEVLDVEESVSKDVWVKRYRQTLSNIQSIQDLSGFEERPFETSSGYMQVTKVEVI